MPRKIPFPVLDDTPRDISYLKPKGYEKHYTMRELCKLVGRDASWIRKLERADRIPKAYRVSHGALDVRLWSPKQVAEIQAILKTLKPGRKRK